jgi:hypothetical protein
VRRPSPATILALIAVLATWTTSSFAARLLTGKDIRDRSLTGAELRSNSVTGRVVANLSGRDLLTDSIDGTDVEESSLAEVPSARRAGSAAHADDATSAASLSGARLRRVSYARPAGSDTANALELGGLTLRARCSASGDLDVTAMTSGSSLVRVATTLRSGNSTSAGFAKDDEFTPGDEFDVLAGGSDNSQGTLTYYALDGDIVTVTFLAESAVASGRGFSCLFAGTAVHTPA